MHNTLKRIINKIKKLEKRELNEEQQKALDALKVRAKNFSPLRDKKHHFMFHAEGV